MKHKDINLGGKLNFFLGPFEVWGSLAQEYFLSYLFLRKLGEAGLLDVELVKLKPTWTNNRTSPNIIMKRLDHFLVLEGLMDIIVRIR